MLNIWPFNKRTRKSSQSQQNNTWTQPTNGNGTVQHTPGGNGQVEGPVLSQVEGSPVKIQAMLYLDATLALLDRLTHRANIVEFVGQSYRFRERMQRETQQEE